MHSSGITIWFFIGLLLVIYGAMIFGYGVFEWATGNYPAGVQLTALHTPVWWGASMTFLGLIYVVKFRPGRTQR